MNILNPEWLYQQLQIVNAFEAETLDENVITTSLEECLDGYAEGRITRIAGEMLDDVLTAELVVGALLQAFQEQEYRWKGTYDNAEGFAKEKLKISECYARKLMELSKSLDERDIRISLGKLNRVPIYKLHWYHKFLNSKNVEAWVNTIQFYGGDRDEAAFKKMLNRDKARIAKSKREKMSSCRC